MRLCIVALFIETVLHMMADDRDHRGRGPRRVGKTTITL